MNVFDYFFSSTGNLSKKFVIGPSEEITFKQIYEQSLEIAANLKANFGEHNHILLISPNSAFFIISYLAIIKSGNICIPINPIIEQSNLDYIIKITGCNNAFVADKINLTINIPDPRNIIRKSDFVRMLRFKALEKTKFPQFFNGNRTAEILFTSGSTDMPKGVMLSHSNIYNNTDSIISYLKLDQTDIMGVVLPFHYCYGLSLLHTHLKVGGSVVLINDFIFLGSVISALKKYKCTGFAGVPSHFQILLRKSETFLTTEFPDLKYVTQAGGKLHDIFIKEFIENFVNTTFFVMYGQTEATARLTYMPPEFLSIKMGSIGKEIPGVTLQIQNEANIPVRAGEVGEIVAKGKNIMKGYFNDPEATSEVLKNGWLYTGDLGRMDNEGFIYLVGRKKEIIKVGGRRVSPKEIEEVILSVDDVIDCIVEGIYDELLGEAIKATVVLKETANAIVIKQSILRMCNDRLAVFKIPKFISVEKSISMNSAGKKIIKNPFIFNNTNNGALH